MNTPTPETDANEESWRMEYERSREAGWPSINFVVDSDFARKLERERDQARQEPLFSQRLVPKLMAERDELRRVCDDLAKSVATWDPDYGVIPNPALTAYNQLQHVKGQPK